MILLIRWRSCAGSIKGSDSFTFKRLVRTFTSATHFPSSTDEIRAFLALMVCSAILLGALSGCDVSGQGAATEAQYKAALNLAARGRTGEAASLLEATVPAVQRAYGENNINVAITMSGLGDVYLAQGRYYESEQTQRRALAIAEQHGYDTPVEAMILINLANALGPQGRITETQSIIRHVIAVLEKAQPVNEEQLGKSYVILCTTYSPQQHFAEALPYCSVAVEHIRRAVAQGSDRGALANSLSVLGADEAKLHHFNEARAHLNEARELAKTLNRPTLNAVTMSNLALLDLEEGHHTNAEAPFAEATRILNQSLPSYNTIAAATALQLRVQLQKRG